MRITHAAVIERLRIAIREHGTQSQTAKRLGISDAYLSDVLSHRRAPGEKILKALHLRRVELYEEAR